MHARKMYLSSPKQLSRRYLPSARPMAVAGDKLVLAPGDCRVHVRDGG